MKKRLLASALAFALAFSLAACGSSGDGPEPAPDPEPVSINYAVGGERVIDYIMNEDETESLCEYGYTKLTAEGVSDAVKKVMNEYNEEASAEVYETATEYSGWRAEYPDDELPVFAMDKTVSITRADNHAFSFVEMNYSYAGGAHPNTYYAAFNFDAETGKRIELSDAVSDVDAFLDDVTDKVMEKYADEIFQGEEGLRESLNPENLTWSLGYDGITVIFSPYEIASYAAGMLYVTIPYEEESVYADIPEEYVIPMDMVSEIIVNGKKLSVGADYAFDIDDMGTVCSIKVSYGGKTAACNASYMSITPYYVKTKDSQYVYIPCRLQDDSYLAEVFEISADEPSYSRQIEGISYGGTWTDTNF